MVIAGRGSTRAGQPAPMWKTQKQRPCWEQKIGRPPPFLVGSLSVELLPRSSESGWNKTTSYPAFSGADGQEAMDWYQGATVFTFFTCTPRGPGGGLLEGQGPLQRLCPEMMVLKEPQA